MQQIENKFKDPESKNKLKQLKIDAQKQIERNKIILKDFINQYSSFHLDHLCVDQKEIIANKTTKTKMILIMEEVGQRSSPW